MQRFPGYTLSSLMDEDTELMRLLAIEQLGTPEQTEGGNPEWPTT